ncbi:tRNA-dihydrouridine synthase [Candidatus Nomurabacteria bacterium]|nr:tRNA-dihydrouridine synthase [Candidatus Nomurabacteria bacterium]
MNNFWQKLNKPFFVLAPMADVTDCAFRQIINKYGKPDVFWTEFVSADGLAHPEARPKLLIDLKFSPNEHPIVAQIFGSRPENIREAAKLCVELGFDGLDINMGCPDKSIEKQGAGAACIKNPALSIEVIHAAREGGGGLPVSVKTRIGYNKEEIDTWIATLLKEKLPVLTVHLRTRKEMSLVPAHWELMPRIIELRNKISPETLIIGNGDVTDLKDAEEKIKKYGCDGVMFGRAIFGNPWLFSASQTYGNHLSDLVERDTESKLHVMVEHTKLFEEMLGKHKNFAIMKKHYKAYVNGFDGAKELRVKLMEAENADEVEKITNDFLKNI